jgi:membrane-bound lytic murein transglycosylase D
MRRLVVPALTAFLGLGSVTGWGASARAEPTSKPPGSAARAANGQKSANSSASVPAKPSGSAEGSRKSTPEPNASKRANGGGTSDSRTTANPGAKAAPEKASSEKSAREKAAPEKPKPKPQKAQPAKASSKTSQKGRFSKQASSTLPPGSQKGEPNEAARRQIALGPTAEDLKAEKPDAELKALSEAEKVLFPRAVPGLTSGWSWDLPRPIAGRGPTVSSSGVPPTHGPGARPGEAEPTHEDAEWLKTLTPPNVPIRLDARVVKYLKFYRDNPKGRSILRVWAQKSGKYLPTMQAEFAKAGLPSDLAWLSLIESGHNPTIQSPAGAAGLWQIVPETARLYGLTVDRWMDERLCPKRSTEAAVLYLSDLYRRFGTWELALAAYNMGFGGLSKAIRKYNTNDFWELGRQEAGMPWETTLYVPKILATAIAMNNKKRFGLADVTPAPSMAFDTVMVRPGVPLSQVAAAARAPLTTVEELNPQYLRSRTPPAAPNTSSNVKSSSGASGKGNGKALMYPVRVPAGKGTLATAGLVTAEDPEAEAVTYLVRFGDTAKVIASDLGVSAERLVYLNGLGDSEALAPGTVLLVPKRQGAGEPRDPEESVAVVSSSEFNYPDRRRVFFRTRSVDTLNGIAQEFGVTAEELLAWNVLDKSARLQSGMTLQLFVSKSNALEKVRHSEEKDVRVLVVGSDDFFDYFEGLNGRKRLRVAVKNGDTLRTIGQRYGMTVGSMERVNRRANNEPLRVGETVIVYAAQNTVGVRAAEKEKEPEILPLPPVKLDGEELLTAGGT